MMKHQLIISAAAAIIMPLAGMAQSLNKEITVERDIVPEQREATRIGFTPRITLRPVALKQLSYSENGVTAQVPASISVLDPAAYADSIYVSPYKGYAAIGFMPRYNAALSLGYRIIETERTRLGAWMQYDGTSYKHTFGNPPSGECGTDERKELTYNRHTATAAVDFRQLVGARSAIDLALDYTFVRYSNPSLDQIVDKTYNQNIHRLNTDALWTSGFNDLTYTVGARFSRFAYVNSTPKAFLLDFIDEVNSPTRPVRESNLGLNASLRADFDDNSLAELGVDFSSLSYNQTGVITMSGGGDITEVELPRPYHPILSQLSGFTTWLLRFTPRYRYVTGIATVDLGVKIDLTHNAGKAFHIAPDVTLGLNPSSKFSVSFRAGGGEEQNTLGSLYAVNPYMASLFAYTNSHVPFTLDAEMTVGPFSGAYLTLFGGYAKANEWLMPVWNYFSLFTFSQFTAEDVKGWHAGVAAGYKWRDAVDARVSFETASHSDSDPSSAYYLWRDRAKFVVDASVRVTPISPLDITLGYNLRSKRQIKYVSETVNASPYFFQSVGSVSNLSAGASWRFTPQLTVFLKGENLLNHDYSLLSLIPAQGLTGLAGLSYKF